LMFSFLSFYYFYGMMRLAFAIIAAIFLVVGILGIFSSRQRAKYWEVRVEGSNIYYKTMFKSNVYSVNDITRISEKENTTRFYSENRELFLMHVSCSGYKQFMDYLNAQNNELAEKSQEIQDEEDAVQSKHLLKFQIWLSIAVFVLSMAAIIVGVDVLNFSLLGVRLALFGSLALLFILYLGNLYIIISCLRREFPFKKVKVYIVAGIHIFHAAVIMYVAVFDHVLVAAVWFVVGSLFTLIISLWFTGGGMTIVRRHITAFVYFLVAAAIFYMPVAEGIPRFAVLEQEAARERQAELRRSTLEISDESIYRAGRDVIASIDDYLNDLITADEAETAVLQSLNAIPRVGSGISLTSDEDRIRWYIMHIAGSWGSSRSEEESRAEIAESQFELRELLNRPRR